MRLPNWAILSTATAILNCAPAVFADFVVDSGGQNIVQVVDQITGEYTPAITSLYSLPVSSITSASIVGASAIERFVGNRSSVNWNITDTTGRDHNVLDMTYAFFDFHVSAETRFSVTDSWNGQLSPGFSRFSYGLENLSIPAPATQVLFATNFQSLDGATTLDTITGSTNVILFPGQDYFFNLITEIDSPANIDGTPFVASGSFEFSLAVPEPSSFALLALGGIGMAMCPYRRGQAYLTRRRRNLLETPSTKSREAFRNSVQ